MFHVGDGVTGCRGELWWDAREGGPSLRLTLRSQGRPEPVRVTSLESSDLREPRRSFSLLLVFSWDLYR